MLNEVIDGKKNSKMTAICLGFIVQIIWISVTMYTDSGATIYFYSICGNLRGIRRNKESNKTLQFFLVLTIVIEIAAPFYE